MKKFLIVSTCACLIFDSREADVETEFGMQDIYQGSGPVRGGEQAA